MANVGRLLPWPNPEGERSYLDPGSDGGFLARLADEIEATQLATGAEVLRHARFVTADPKASETELRFVVARLAECLTDALRVAESRGAQLTGGGRS